MAGALSLPTLVFFFWFDPHPLLTAASADPLSPSPPPLPQAFYYDGSPTMSNEEFELLKEELTWAGSKVAVLSSDELRFLEASLAFQAGKPVMTDAAYDALKVRLRAADSFVTQQGPRCSLRSKRVFANARPDYLKMTALNLPAALLTLGALFAADDLTGFEITKLVELPEPIGILVVWGFVLPLVYVIASGITGAVIRDPLILRAPCPNCGAETQSFFGDILTVAGNATDAEVACGGCGAKLRFDRAAREVTLLEGPPPPKAAV